MKLSSPTPIRLLSAARTGDRRPLAAGALVIWIAISPWLWGFAGARPAVADHVFLVMAFGPIALMIGALRPAAFVTIAGGLWLALSPWLLGYAGEHLAWLNELITGSLLAVLALSATGIPVRRPDRRTLDAPPRTAHPIPPSSNAPLSGVG